MPWTRTVAPNGSGPGIRANGRPSGRAQDLEERTGQRSAERIAIEEAAPIIRQARSWRELHAALAAQGMRYEKKGSGALLWIGEQPVKASTAGRDCSMAALRKRLGEFEPAPSTPVRRPSSIASRRPIGAHAARLPRRTPQALPGPRGQTSASNR